MEGGCSRLTMEECVVVGPREEGPYFALISTKYGVCKSLNGIWWEVSRLGWRLEIGDSWKGI